MTLSATDAPSSSDTLANWLAWLEALHPVEIDLGLERVARVADRAGLRPITQPLIIVGGTNGKGSTVQMLSVIYSEAGYRAGVYTSPHIIDFNERIRINEEMASDAAIVKALADIEEHRQDDTLTYFEYTTLAAMRLFLDRQCDVIILEVGLGGRLDAANIWDADCAIVTSIAVDHEAWLGSDREVIGREKAAIGRSGRPLIIGDANPPASVSALAVERGMQLQLIEPVDSSVTSLAGEHQRRNTACALAAADALRSRLPLVDGLVSTALRKASLAGRFEHREVDGVNVILDVAHNPAAAIVLRKTMQHEYPDASVHLVLAMLADKDIDGVLQALNPVVDHWYCAQLDVPRAAPVKQLADEVQQISQQGDTTVQRYDSVVDAWQAALRACVQVNQQELAKQAMILVAGSFYTIGALQTHWRTMQPDDTTNELPDAQSTSAPSLSSAT